MNVIILRRRRRPSLRASVRVLLGLAVVLPLLAVTPTPVFAAGLRESGKTTYEFIPDQGKIKVTVELTIENRQADTKESRICTRWVYDFWLGWTLDYYTCSSTTSWYTNATSLEIEREARNVVATTSGGKASTTTIRTLGRFKSEKITFPKTWYGQKRKVTVTYDIPGGKPRSEQSIRAGKAYADFCIGGNGDDAGTVTAIVPGGFKLDLLGDPLTSTTSNGKTILTSGSLTEPELFQACIEATNDAAYNAKTISAGGQEVRVLAWPEDPEWAQEAQEVVARSLPELESLIGVPPPGRGAIIVREVTDQGLGEYVGTYDPDTRSASVSEHLDASTIAHELAHVWFNDGLFNERWLSEGYASYAEKAAGRASSTACTMPGTYPGTGQPNLKKWKWLGPRSSATDRKVVTYLYDAACWIATSTAGRIGDSGLRAVFASAVGHRIAYQGAGPGETEGWGPLTWRTWLDLVDENTPSGTSGPSAAQELLVKYGIADDEAALAARSTARSQYSALKTAADGWAMPYAVRKPMADWDFDAATTAMASARTQLATRDELTEVAQAAHLDHQVRLVFEQARTIAELEAVSQRAARLLTVGAELDRAEQAAAAPRDPLTTLGLAFGPEPATVAQAGIAHLADGDDVAASASAAVTERLLADAFTGGIVRFAGALGALVLLVVSALLVRRSRARSRRRPVAPVVVPAIAPVVDRDGATAPEEDPAASI